MGAGLYSHTTRSAGTTLTANIYNTDHQNHIDNHNTTQIDDYSASVVEMQTTTDPGEVATESQATTLAGELERLRFAVKEIKRQDQWYESGWGTAPATPVNNQLYQDTIVKAWCNWVMVTGVPTADTEVNIASITDNNTGDYTFNFTTPIATSNYAAVTSAESSGVLKIAQTNTLASGSVQVLTGSDAGAAQDIDGSVLVVGSA